jgi:hypothetical protein
LGVLKHGFSDRLLEVDNALFSDFCPLRNPY